MSEQKEPLSPLLSDREITRQLAKRAVDIGTPLIAGSALVVDRPFSPQDVVATRELIQAVSPVTVDNFQLHAHLQLTATFSRKMAEAMKLDPIEMEILGSLHDFGRFITHRWLRHELIENHVLRRMGVREDLLNKTPSVSIFLHRDPERQSDVEQMVNGLSLEQKVLMMADICGKRKNDGGIFTFDEVMQYHQASRRNYQATTNLAPLWPSEKKLNPTVVDFSEKVYRACFDWFKARGLDLAELRTQILKEESATPIKAVLFDVGNVLLMNPDAETMSDISQSFAVALDIVTKAWDELVPRLQIGAINTEEFWRQFSERVGKPLPADYETLWTKHLQTNIDPELDELIDALKQSKYKIAVFSDTIWPHIIAFEQAGFYGKFDVRILSPEIRTTKGRLEAFTIASLKMWLPPQGCFFTDDKVKYIEDAINAKMKAVVYENPSQLKRALSDAGVTGI